MQTVSSLASNQSQFVSFAYQYDGSVTTLNASGSVDFADDNP